MNDSFTNKTIQDVLEGPDDELLQIVVILSKEARKRSNAKMADPAYRAQIAAGMNKIFASKDPSSKL